MDEYGYVALSAGEIARAALRREVAATEVVSVALQRAGQLEPQLHAFTELWCGEAVALAGDVGRRVTAGDPLPLAGVPIGVKGPRGDRTAAARRLVAAGCVPVGASGSLGSDRNPRPGAYPGARAGPDTGVGTLTVSGRRVAAVGGCSRHLVRVVGVGGLPHHG